MLGCHMNRSCLHTCNICLTMVTIKRRPLVPGLAIFNVHLISCIQSSLIGFYTFLETFNIFILMLILSIIGICICKERFDYLPSLNTQSCIRGFWGYGISVFGLFGQPGKYRKKKSGADYEQL